MPVEISCEIAVVGAGVIGCSTAYWISRMDPARRVVLVDGGRVAGGASGRNAGFLLQGPQSDPVLDRIAFGVERARLLHRFMQENRDAIFRELDGAAFDLEASGSFIVAGSEDENDRLRESASLMRAEGMSADYYPADATNRRLRSKGFWGGLHVLSGAMLDSRALVRHIAARSGAELLENATVESVEGRGGGLAMETSRGVIRAERAVLAVNAWLPLLFPMLGRYVRPVRAQMYAVHAVEERWLDVPVYSHEGYFYARQTMQGAFLVGGARHLHREGEVGYDVVTTSAVQSDIEAYVRDHFPQAAGQPVARRWSGIMGFSPDHAPVVGEVPGVPGSVWAAGFSGHGMGYGFWFGRMLAAWVLGNGCREDRALFGVERFGREGTGSETFGRVP